MKNIFLIAIVLSLFSLKSASSDLVVGNPITTANPSAWAVFALGQTTSPNVTSTGIGRGAGIEAVVNEDRYNASNRYNANNWNNGPTLDLSDNDYFTFTITPNVGFQIDFDNFIYTGTASNVGPTSFAFRTSVDSFGSSFGSPSATGTTIDLSSLASVTSAIEFRFYGWGASHSGVNSQFSINDFAFNGTVTAIPEPTAMLLVVSLLGLVGFKRRR